MEKMRRSTPQAFLILGLVFLVIGFVQQGFTLSFDSGFFTLGVIFVLSGLIGYPLRPKLDDGE